jgi:hypothetical protein
MVDVEVAQQDKVDVGVEGRIDRADDASQEHQTVDEERIGQDPQPLQLDEHRGMTEEGQAGEGHAQNLGPALGRPRLRGLGAFGPGS